MLNINKSILLNEKKQAIAVQIPIKDFQKLEDIIENYGLAKLMDDVDEQKRLSIKDAKKYYQTLKSDV